MPPGGADEPVVSRLARTCLLAWLAAVLLRALAAARCGGVGPDGCVDLEVARALASGRLADALDTRFQPLTGALVAPFVALGAPAEPAALVVVVLTSALVAPLCALSAATLVGALGPGRTGVLRAAALAGLLAAAQPYLVRLGGQVMAYGPAHALLALALLATLRAAATPTPRRAALVGAAIGLGYLARTDALATGAGLAAAVVLAAATSRGDDTRAPEPRARRAGRTALVAIALLAGLLAVAGPFLVLLRAHGGEWRLSLKKRVGDLLAARLEPAPTVRAEAAPRATSLVELVRAEETGGDLVVARDAESTRPPLPAAAWFALRKAAAAANEEALALALLGLVALIRATRRADASSPGGRVTIAAALLALATSVAAHALLKASVGYTSKIHLSGAAVLVTPLAGVGLALALARVRRCGALVVLVAAALAYPVAKSLEPQHPERRDLRALGERIRADAGAGALVLAGRDARPVALHAGATYLDLPPGAPQDALDALRADGARYLVVFLRTHGPTRPGALDGALLAAGAVPFESLTVTGEEDVRYHALAWHIPPSRP